MAMTSSHNATPEEVQEALSRRYVDAARVVRLTSGRYAVFSMARGHILAVTDEAGLAAAVVEACERSASDWEECKRIEKKEQEPAPVAKTAGELGL